MVQALITACSYAMTYNGYFLLTLMLLVGAAWSAILIPESPESKFFLERN